MKTPRTFGPFWLGLLALVIVVCLLRTSWDLHRENEALRATGSLLSASPPPAKAEESPPVPPGKQSPASPLRLEDLRAETQREIATRRSIEAKIAALEQKLPAKEGEVLVSFGRIEEMGQHAAALLRLLAKIGREAQQRGDGSWPDLPPEGTALFTDFLGQLSELRSMENEPREIARFQAAALKDFFGLDAATTTRVTAILETEFAQLETQQLTAPFRPEDFADWDRRRDAAITGVAARLRPLLPLNHQDLPLLPGVLSLGAGVRTEVNTGPNGREMFTMGLPLFPKKF